MTRDSTPSQAAFLHPVPTDQPGLLIRFLENLEEAPAWEGQIALLPYFGSSQANPTWEWESTINPAVYWRKPMLWAHLANEYLYSQKIVPIVVLQRGKP